MDLKSDQFKNYLKSKKVTKAAELIQILGNRMALSRVAKEGLTQALGGGYYSSPQLTQLQAVILIISRYYPFAVLSGAASLTLFGFELPISDIRVDTDISKPIRNQLFKTRRVRLNRRKPDLVTHAFMNEKVTTYILERCLCEAAKDLAFTDKKMWKKILNQLPQMPDIDFEKVLFFDQMLGTNVGDELKRQSKAIDLKGPHTLRHPNLKNQSEEKFKLRNELLEIALRSYAELGDAGLDLSKLADTAGISKLKVSSIFKGKLGLKAAMIAFYGSKMPNETAFPPIDGVEDPIAFTQMILSEQFRFKDSDRWDYRIQSWMTAAQEPLALDVIEKVCGPLIKFVAGLIRKVEPKIPEETAIARAAVIVGQGDYYGSIRWFYLRALDLPISQSHFLEQYKRSVLEDLIPSMFKP